MKVQKFGGTSVGSAKRIQDVAGLVKSFEGRNIIVLSAMSGTTNSLIEISNALHKGDKNNAETLIQGLEDKYKDVIDELYSTEKSKEEALQIVGEIFQDIRNLAEKKFTPRTEKIIVSKGEIISTNLMYLYMMEKGYEDLDPAINIHRTFFACHLQYFLKGLRKIYKDYGSIDNFGLLHKVGEDEAPAWRLVEEINRVMCEENGAPMQRCLPLDTKNSALKRVNMALRWLVRDDGIVDMGVWKSIPKSKLYIPLDVHVGNVSRELGLLSRKANDRKSVEELTGVLREIRPEDPAIYDFALFGIGIGE